MQGLAVDDNERASGIGAGLMNFGGNKNLSGPCPSSHKERSFLLRERSDLLLQLLHLTRISNDRPFMGVGVQDHVERFSPLV